MIPELFLVIHSGSTCRCTKTAAAPAKTHPMGARLFIKEGEKKKKGTPTVR